MRILFLNKLLAKVFGGTEKHIKELITLLAKRGHQITVLTEKGDMKNLEDISKLKNVKIVFLPSTEVVFKSYKTIKETRWFKRVENNRILWRIFITLKRVISLKKNFKWFMNSFRWVSSHRKEFDVMSVHFYYEFEEAKLLHLLKSIPYVAVLEGYSFLESDTVRRSKYVMTISDFIVDTCKTVHKFEPELIPIGIRSEKFRDFEKNKVNEIRKKYLKKGDLLALNVARLVRGKGVENMIRAAGVALKKKKNIQFIVCGDGIERENYEKMIKTLGIEKNFHLVNAFGNDLIDYYNAADFFVHVPDLSNHFGIVYLEAMSVGLPIIASDYEATPSTVGDAALLVPIENPEKLAEAIITVSENSALRKELSKKGLKRVKDKFNWDNLAPKIENLFQRAARKL